MYNMNALAKEIPHMFKGHLGNRFVLYRDSKGNVDSAYDHD